MTNYKESRTLSEVFNSLRGYYECRYSEVARSLNKPATENELARLEESINQELPEEFKELYRIANGQKGGTKSFFQHAYAFMPIDAIIRQWKMLMSLYNEYPEFRDIRSSSEKILDTLWQPEWIPFGDNESSDYCCLDLKPGEKGTKGQVIESFRAGDTRYLGASITDFLGEFDAGLKSGKYYMHKDYGVIVSDERS